MNLCRDELITINSDKNNITTINHYKNLNEQPLSMNLNEESALEPPRRDNTCASMGKFEKIRSKSRSERCFLMIFSDFFRKPQGDFPRKDLKIFEGFSMS